MAREFVQCPCGRTIAGQNKKVHAGACEHARNAGWPTPLKRVTQCWCKCGEEIVSYSSKHTHFVNSKHYDKWRRSQPEVAEKNNARKVRWRKANEPRRSLTEAQEQHEREAMTPFQRSEEEDRALYEHSNATFFNSPTYWGAERIRLEALSWRKVDEASGAVA